MTEDPQNDGPELPGIEECRKCGAKFRWEPSNPTVKASPLVARLVKADDACDCGYGKVGPIASEPEG